MSRYCDGAGPVPIEYFGGDGKGVVVCAFCGRKFLARARKDDAPWADGEEHFVANVPAHKIGRRTAKVSP